MAYLLDANVFIEAKNRYYGFEICPGFWDWLLKENNLGKVFSIDKVGDELSSGNDPLAEWAKDQASKLFLEPDAKMVEAMERVSTWLNRQQYEAAAINTFLEGADFYLVSYALAHNHTIVTQEVASEGKRRIKIPNVCVGLRVKFKNPFEMLRIEHARFILQ